MHHSDEGRWRTIRDAQQRVHSDGAIACSANHTLVCKWDRRACLLIGPPQTCHCPHQQALFLVVVGPSLRSCVCGGHREEPLSICGFTARGIEEGEAERKRRASGRDLDLGRSRASLTAARLTAREASPDWCWVRYRGSHILFGLDAPEIMEELEHTCPPPRTVRDMCFVFVEGICDPLRITFSLFSVCVCLFVLLSEWYWACETAVKVSCFVLTICVLFIMLLLILCF